jgi:hypothetical protein
MYSEPLCKSSHALSKRREDVACLAIGDDIALVDVDKKMAAAEQPTHNSTAAKLTLTMAKRMNPQQLA